MNRLAMTVPTFSNHVCYVVCLRTYEQVSRVTARRVIAGMENRQPALNWAVGKNVGHAVRTLRAVVVTEHPIAMCINSTSPEPTGTEFGAMLSDGTVLVNLAPKPFLGRLQLPAIPTGARAIFVCLLRVMQKHLATYKASTFCSRNAWSTNRFACYNIHANASLQVLDEPGMFAHRPDISCLHYTMNGGYALG